MGLSPVYLKEDTQGVILLHRLFTLPKWGMIVTVELTLKKENSNCIKTVGFCRGGHEEFYYSSKGFSTLYQSLIHECHHYK